MYRCVAFTLQLIFFCEQSSKTSISTLVVMLSKWWHYMACPANRMYVYFQLFMNLFRFDVDNYQHCLGSIFESVRASEAFMVIKV